MKYSQNICFITVQKESSNAAKDMYGTKKIIDAYLSAAVRS